MLEHIGHTYLAYFGLHIVPSYEGFILFHSLKVERNLVEEVQLFVITHSLQNETLQEM
jgi:hypothetical protein